MRRWPLFVAGVIVCLALAFLYLRYSTAVYNTVATIIIKDEKKGAGSSELAAFADLGLLGGMGTSSIENEIGILKSKRLMTNVVKELDLNVRYFYAETVPPTEVFVERPFNIQVLAFDAERFRKIEEPEPLIFTILSDSTFSVKAEDIGTKKLNFGEAFPLPYAEISVTPNQPELSEAVEKGQVKIIFNTVDAAAAAWDAPGL